MKKQIYILGLVLVSLAVFIWVHQSRQDISTEKKPLVIKIGVISPLAGELAVMGEGVKNSIELALLHISQNKIPEGNQGGVNLSGLRLEAVYQDDQCDPKKAVSAYQQLKSEGAHIFYIACSGSVLAVAPLAKTDGNLIVTAYAGSSEIRKTGDEVIRAIPDGLSVVGAIEAYAKKLPESATFAVLYENQAYSSSVASDMKASLGSKIVAGLPYKSTERTYQNDLLKIKASGAEYIIFVPVSDKSARIIYADMKTLGMGQPVIGDANVCDYPFNPSEYGIKYTCFKAEMNGPVAERFKKDYKNQFGVESQYAFYDMVTYDLIFILNSAIGESVKSGGFSIQKIKNYIKAGVTGVIGEYKFDQTGKVVDTEYLVVKGN